MVKRSVAEVISGHRVVNLASDATVRAAANLMTTAHVASVVVVDGDDRAIGIFTERDLTERVVAAGLDPQTTPLDRVMTHTPITTPQDTAVGEVLRIMHLNNLRHLPVVKDDKVIGVVSMRDFVGAELAASQHDFDIMDSLTEHML